MDWERRKTLRSAAEEELLRVIPRKRAALGHGFGHGASPTANKPKPPRRGALRRHAWAFLPGSPRWMITVQRRPFIVLGDFEHDRRCAKACYCPRLPRRRHLARPLGPPRDRHRRDRDARPHGHPRGVCLAPAPQGRSHHRLAPHDHPDGRPDRDAQGPRCRGPLGLVQHLLDPGSCRRRHRRRRHPRLSPTRASPSRSTGNTPTRSSSGPTAATRT